MQASILIVLLSGVAASDLSLTWSDCGSASAHAKIVDFTPTKLVLGQKTTMTGNGNLDEQVTKATFDLTMTGAIGTLLHCTGDASQSKTCNLPLGVGSLTFDAMAFPLAPGTVPVKVDINLKNGLPTPLQTTTTTAKATDQNGQELFCIQIKSAPASGSSHEVSESTLIMEIPTIPLGAAEQAAAELSLTWSDCGSASAHAKIVDFSPTKLVLGQKTTMTGHGNLDEQVTKATFDLTMTGAIGTLLHCTGDASQSKTCNLPLGVGSLTFDAMTFPLAPGTVPVNVDINLKNGLPTPLQTTTTTAKATDQNGQELFCIQIKSAPASATVSMTRDSIVLI